MLNSFDSIKRIEPCLQRHVFENEYRQKVITGIIGESLVEGSADEGALGRLFWHSSFLEPPLTRDELLYCQALLRMLHSFDDIKIDSMQRVFEILEIPLEKMSLPEKDLGKAVKKAYWDRFNKLFRGFKSLYDNAREITAITRAFNFFCRSV